jgi:hypothetical protein
MCGIVVGGLILLVMQQAQAQDSKSFTAYPSSRLGVRTAPLLLLSRPDVCADLGLTADQAASAHRTIQELYTQALDLRGKSGPSVVEARRIIDAKQDQWIEYNLKPDQRLRLAEIELQWEGPGALGSRGYLADELGLTVEQRERIRTLVQQSHASGAASKGSARHLAGAILGVLTPEQATQWRKMLGRPFAIQDAMIQPVNGITPGPGNQNNRAGAR